MIKLLSGALILGIILGSIITFAFFKPHPKVVNIEIPAQEIKAVLDSIAKLQRIIEDIEFPTSYIIVEGKDTTVVDSNTLYKDVPVTATTWDSSFVIFINKQPQLTDYYQEVIAKGEVFEVTFGLYQAEFNVEMAAPSNWDFDLSVGSWIDENKRFHGALMAELWYKKFALSPQIRIEPVEREKEIKYEIRYLVGWEYEIV